MKIAVVSNSCEVHARNIVDVCNKILNPKFEFTLMPYDGMYDSGWELVDFSQYDVLLNIGYFVPVATFLESVRRAEPELKVVNVWVGSDILQNVGHASAGMTQHRDAALNYINLADCDKFVGELDALLDIEARAVKTCPKDMPEVTPMPEEPRILVYLPGHRAAFYNVELLLEVASMAVDTTFTFVGVDPSHAPTLPNVRWLSMLSREAWLAEIQRSTGSLRCPQHDGVSVSTLETLAAGRYVVTNQPGIPNTIYADKVVDVYLAVRQIAALKEPNVAGAAWVRDNYSPEAMAESYRVVLDGL